MRYEIYIAADGIPRHDAVVNAPSVEAALKLGMTMAEAWKPEIMPSRDVLIDVSVRKDYGNEVAHETFLRSYR